MRQRAGRGPDRAVLLLGVHLAKRPGLAVRHEDRVVAIGDRAAAAGPDQRALALAEIFLGVAVRPGEAEQGNELCAALRRLQRNLFLQLLLDEAHRHVPVAVGTGPVGGVDARRAVQCLDAEAGIIGQRHFAGCRGRRQRLDAGVLDEGRAGLFRLGQAELSGGDQLDREAAQQEFQFADLALVVAGDEQSLAVDPAGFPPALIGDAAHRPGSLTRSPGAAARPASRCRTWQGRAAQRVRPR